MPPHPDRIRQNYCEHSLVAKIESEEGIFQMCLQCLKRVDVLKKLIREPITDPDNPVDL